MKRIAIDINLNKDWIGGSYYIRNLVTALGMLPEAERPQVTLLSNDPESIRFGLESGFPDLRWIRSKDFYDSPEDYPFDVIFPWSTPDQAYRTISWIPDFQELHLPYYFDAQELANRRYHHRQRFAAAGLVVSSEDVRKDVERFYPGECPNIAVVHFASFDRPGTEPLDAIRARYGLGDSYVMCANQVWIHKNHILILRALAILKSRGLDRTVVFTGNESDYRVKGFSKFLRKVARQWGIADNVRFLGFIPRDDQLSLMKGAAYIIQPSLFEGWSTTIEDAKAMGQVVVASDLAVHKEQLSADGRFFPRHDPEALAGIMQEFALTPPRRDATESYDENRRAFGRDFIRAVDRFVGEAGPVPRKLGDDDVAALSARNLETLSG